MKKLLALSLAAVTTLSLLCSGVFVTPAYAVAGDKPSRFDFQSISISGRTVELGMRYQITGGYNADKIYWWVYGTKNGVMTDYSVVVYPTSSPNGATGTVRLSGATMPSKDDGKVPTYTGAFRQGTTYYVTFTLPTDLEDQQLNVRARAGNANGVGQYGGINGTSQNNPGCSDCSETLISPTALESAAQRGISNAEYIRYFKVQTLDGTIVDNNKLNYKLSLTVPSGAPLVTEAGFNVYVWNGVDFSTLYKKQDKTYASGIGSHQLDLNLNDALPSNFYLVKAYAKNANGLIKEAENQWGWFLITADTYNITYNLNGGSGSFPTQEKYKDVSLTLHSTKPTRTGYDFLGWSTSSTATSATYSAGGSYTANSPATLWAVWASYGISLTPSTAKTFTAATVGYGAQTAHSVTVGNTGNQATGALTVALSGTNASSFTLSKTSISSIAVSGSDSFTVVPKTGLAAGTYTATVTVSGSANITARSFTVSFTVNTASTSISLSPSTAKTFTAATVGYGAQTAHSVTVNNTGNQATGALTVALSGTNASNFTLSKTSISSIAVSGSDSFTVVPKTGLAAGTYTATVTVSGSVSLTAQSFNVSFTVNAYGISLNPSTDKTFTAAIVGYGAQTAHSVTVSNIGNQATGALTVALSGTNASSFTLSKTAISSIAVSGSDSFTVVPKTGLAAGTYTATVTVSGGSNITARSFTVSFTVNSAPTKNVPTVTTQDIQTSTITENGAKLTGAIVDNGGESISGVGFIYYAKSNPNAKYTVNATLADFSKTITGLTADTDYRYYAYATNSVGVGYGVEKTFRTLPVAHPVPVSITLNPTNISLVKGSATSLIATVLPENAENRNVVWSSDNKAIATVDQTGKVTAITTGNTIVRAVTEVGRLEATCAVAVTTNEITGSFDFSEINMATHMSSLAGTNGVIRTPQSGGHWIYASAYLARWGGAVLESRDKYPTSISNIRYNQISADYHVQEILKIPARLNKTDNDGIKSAVYKYGAVSSSFYVNGSYGCFTNNNSTYYQPESLNNAPSSTIDGGHAVAIIGWDDNYDKNKFSFTYNGTKYTPPENGAFICKNSWGTGSGLGGYFYISYYDKNIGIRNGNAVYTGLESNANYNKIYQYDPLGWNDTIYTGRYMANIFDCSGTEMLEAVAFYTVAPDVSYEVYVVSEVNGSSSLVNLGSVVAKGTQSYAGYHTVRLDSPIQIKAGKFAVIVKLLNSSSIATETAYGEYTNAKASAGQSFTSVDGKTWVDVSADAATNVCVKAFTKTTGISSMATLFGVENDTFSGNSFVYDIEDVGGLNPEYVEWYRRKNPKGLRLFSVDDDEPFGDAPPPVLTEEADEIYSDGAILPAKFDLRDINAVTLVKDQGSLGVCWTFAAYASLESTTLKKSGYMGDNFYSDSVVFVPLSALTLDKTFLLMSVGGNYVFNTAPMPADASDTTVLYSSSDETVIIVDTSGNAVALKKGSAIITAQNVDGTITTSCEIVVTDPQAVVGVSFEQMQINMKLNDVQLLNYSVYPENAGNKSVTFTSINPSIATVNENGVLIAKNPGTTSITVTTSDGNKQAICNVTVEGSDYQIIINGTPTRQGGVNYTVMNNGGSVPVSLILALYDSKGKLIKMEKEDTTLAEGANEKSFPLNTIPAGAYTAKIFCWGSTTSAQPLAEPAPFNLN